PPRAGDIGLVDLAPRLPRQPHDRADKPEAILVVACGHLPRRHQTLRLDRLSAIASSDGSACSRRAISMIRGMSHGGTPSSSRMYSSRSEEHTSELQSRENLVCR